MYQQQKDINKGVADEGSDLIGTQVKKQSPVTIFGAEALMYPGEEVDIIGGL